MTQDLPDHAAAATPADGNRSDAPDPASVDPDVGDPRSTNHPTGVQQAQENAEKELPG